MSMLRIHLLFLFTGLAACGDTMVAPNSMEHVYGNGQANIPFNAPSGNSVRYQQVYDASQFSIFGSEGARITQIQFRVDHTAIGFLTTLPSIRIDMSTTTRAPDGLSTIFAENIGVDNLTVFPAGPLSIRSVGAAGPGTWDIVIPFRNPFVYRPSAGNLLLDIRNFDGRSTAVFDGPFAQGDPVSIVYAYTGDDSGNVNSPSGIANTFGLATLFEYTPIPEPATLYLLAIGVGAATVLCRRRKVGAL